MKVVLKNSLSGFVFECLFFVFWLAILSGGDEYAWKVNLPSLVDSSIYVGPQGIIWHLSASVYYWPYICTMATWNHKYMNFWKQGISAIYLSWSRRQLKVCTMFPRSGRGVSYLSVVVFQNKLSNVISGSFINHQTEQTTSYFGIHHFKNKTKLG